MFDIFPIVRSQINECLVYNEASVVCNVTLGVRVLTLTCSALEMKEQQIRFSLNMA